MNIDLNKCLVMFYKISDFVESTGISSQKFFETFPELVAETDIITIDRIIVSANTDLLYEEAPGVRSGSDETGINSFDTDEKMIYVMVQYLNEG